MEIKYKVVNGTSYHIDTPDEVVKVLEVARKNRTRIRLFYGDTNTGRCWLEVYGTIGRIGRSTGCNKIPLLIKTSRSTGGGAILDDCIVKITIDKKVVYQHPQYHLPEMEIREAEPSLQVKGFLFSVYADGLCTYNCKTMHQAENEIKFHKGLSNRVL